MSKSKLRSGKSAKPAKAKKSLRKAPARAEAKPKVAKSPAKVLKKTTKAGVLPVVRKSRVKSTVVPAPVATLKKIEHPILPRQPVPAAPPVIVQPEKPPADTKEELVPPLEKPSAVFKATQTLPVEHAVAPSAKASIGKPAPVTLPFQIPPILLEGDEPRPVLFPGGKRGKPAAAPPPPARLTETYGSGKLTAMPRDPHCCYVHWDFTYEQQQQFNAASVHGAMVLRVRTVSGKSIPEIHLHKDSRHWFVHVPDANETYRAELGYYQKDGGWVRTAESGEVRTPPDRAADDRTVRFAKMPESETRDFLRERERVEQSQPQGVQSWSGPTLVTSELTFHEIPSVGEPDFPSLEFVAPISFNPSEWTNAQEEALEELVGRWFTRVESFDSGQIEQLILGRTQRKGLAPRKGISFPAPSSAEIALAALAPEKPEGISSLPPGLEQPGRPNFWFNVNAELIIYGATEPGAKVTIGDRPIKLRPDGTFSYRFALPDGYYELPAVAASMDGDRRRADLRFSRSTQYQGEVGEHKQDPALKVPAPENTV